MATNWTSGSKGLLLLVHTLLCLAVHKASAAPAVYSYDLVAEYPHDPGAFTQGLQYDRLCNDASKQCYDILWESTGLNGRSSVRLVNLSSGVVQRKADVPASFFAEGLTRLNDRLYQIAWQTGRGFIYSIPDLHKVGEFDTGLGDGWGLTTDGTHLIATESSPTVHFLDPTTFRRLRTITVNDGGRPIKWLNEVEVVDGELWGNIWQSECIVRVDLSSGNVVGYILMHGLREGLLRSNLPGVHTMDVLNGIAYDKESKRLFVTGKLWPRLYEVRPKPHPRPPPIEQVRSRCWR